MSQKEHVIKPENVEIRVEPSGKLVADVRGLEGGVDPQIMVAGEKKAAEKRWDNSKVEIRKLAGDTRELAARVMGKDVVKVNFLGSQAGFLEVEMSTARKALSPEAVSLANMNGLGQLVLEDVQVVLKGELAAWALTALGDRSASDPDHFVLKRTLLLAPAFEEVARSERIVGTARVPILNRMLDLGVNAPAVEAKVRKG